MPNSSGGIFETLVAASNQASQALKFPNAFLDVVFTSHEPHYATLGNTLNVVIPTVDESTVLDIGAGAIVTKDAAHTTTPIVFAHKLDTSFIVKNWDQVRTPQNLRDLYLDARLEALMRKANRYVANLITATNFSSYTTVTGGPSVFTKSSIKSAWTNLANAGVPVDQAGNVFFITHTVPYGNMTTDSTFAQESIVGAAAADETRKAMFLTQYNAELKYDPMVPMPSATTYAGIYLHKFSIAMRTGVEPPANSAAIQETVTAMRGLPVKLQTWYDPNEQGQKINISLCFGLAVVRPEFGSFLVTA